MSLTFKNGLCGLFFILFLLVNTATASERWVSVGGALTEWIVAMDGEAHLVGVDLSSKFPSQIQKLPNVGYQRQLSIEGIMSLKPNRLIGTGDMGPPNTLEKLADMGINVDKLSSEPNLEALHANLMALGQWMGSPEKANHLYQEFKQTINLPKPSNLPKVMMVLSHSQNTLVAGKNTLGDWLIETSGGINPFYHTGYKPTSLEAIFESKPRWLIIAMTKSSVNQTTAEILKNSSLKHLGLDDKHILTVDMNLLSGGLGIQLAQQAKKINEVLRGLEHETP